MLRSTRYRTSKHVPVFSLILSISESLPIFSVLCTSLNWWQESRCPQSFVLSVLSLGLTVISFFLFFFSFSFFFLVSEKVMSSLINMCVFIASKDNKSKGPYFSCQETIIGWNLVLEFNDFTPRSLGHERLGEYPFDRSTRTSYSPIVLSVFHTRESQTVLSRDPISFFFFQ